MRDLSKTSVKNVYEYRLTNIDMDFFNNIEDILFEYQLKHPDIYLPFGFFWNEKHYNFLFEEWFLHKPQENTALNYRYNVRYSKDYEDILNDLFKIHPEWSGIIYKGVVPEDNNRRQIVPTKRYGIYTFDDDAYYYGIYFDFNYFQEVEEDIFQYQMMNTSMIFPVKGFWTEEHYKKIFHNPKFTKAHNEWKHLASIEDGIFTLYKEFIREYPQYEKLFIKSEED